MPSKKAPAVKGAVIAKHLMGDSMLQISKDLDISRPTVYRILDEAEIDNITRQSHSVIHSAMPEIATCVANHAKKHVVTALEVMDRTGFLPKRAPASGVNMGVNLTLGDNTLNLTQESTVAIAESPRELELDSEAPTL